jgi:hypothetical protein
MISLSFQVFTIVMHPQNQGLNGGHASERTRVLDLDGATLTADTLSADTSMFCSLFHSAFWCLEQLVQSHHRE